MITDRGCGACQYSVVSQIALFLAHWVRSTNIFYSTPLRANGNLTFDENNGFCTQTASVLGRRHASGGVPCAPERNDARGEVTKAMRDRSTLRKGRL